MFFFLLRYFLINSLQTAVLPSYRYRKDLMPLQIAAGFQALRHHIIPPGIIQPVHGSVIHHNRTYLFFGILSFRADHLIGVLRLKRANLFQKIHHPVDCGNSDLVIFCCCLVKNLLAAAAVIFQDRINKPQTLLRDPAALLTHFLYNLFLLLFP